MKTEFRIPFIICLIAIAGVILFQIFWIRNYFQITRDRFEKETNLAFEDALKREFETRNDSLERLMFIFLSDTTQINIRSENKEGKTVYHISNVKDSFDSYSFSKHGLDVQLLSNSDGNRAKVIRAATRTYRMDFLDRHVIRYLTQNQGKFISENAELYKFDTSRLRPYYRVELKKRDITQSFVFRLNAEDNTLNLNSFPDSLTKNYKVITKAFPTYTGEKNMSYVRAMFTEPTGYLFSRTKYLLLGSVVLIIIVSISSFYLLRTINRQKKLSAIKNDFINNITHEFKTPIATVYNAVEALDSFDALRDPEKTKKYLTTSRRELERLSDLVNKILNTSLYENGVHEYKIEKCDIDAIIKDILNARQQVPGAVFNYQNISDRCFVQGDKTHIYNGINNIIDNAVKYSKENPVISIELKDESSFLVISVKDNGIGIKKENLGFIFDKFYRVPATRVKGYGLGLSYTKAIVEKHKGWCSVNSEFGKGSTFSIAFPSTS
jgi:two-component system, OmpR family, phosphate regulon sensor histidine kinase PhoR